MPAYYNEIDPFAVAWLRELIKEKVIADGEVDTRSIKEVQPEDLRRFVQCHFFAGIGVWSYALRCAGWEDDRPVWTGSCPCPSFSAAGQGKGFDDPRHLWPELFRLARECRPAVLFGEQVDDAIGHGWLDLVQNDMEGAGYSVAKAVFGACSVGAPQISSRLYIVAETEIGILRVCGSASRETGRSAQCEPVERMASSASSRRQEEREHGSGLPLFPARPVERSGSGSVASSHGGIAGNGELQRSRQHGLFTQDRSARELVKTERTGLERHAGNGNNGNEPGRLFTREAGSVAEAGPLGGFWRDAVWIYCTDGKWRPVESAPLGLADVTAADLGRVFLEDKAVFFPLLQKGKNRVGRLRGYGNALVAEQAKAFIQSYMDTLEGIYSRHP